MPRIELINSQHATGKAKELLDQVKKAKGMVPNLLKAMANSPAVLQSYLGFSGALADGALPARLREQLAVAVGEVSQCDYCVSAHTAIGKKAGLSDQEALDARRGTAKDPREQAAIVFAQTVVRERGFVSDNDVANLREAGFDNGEIAEIVAHVGLNLFTNYFNHIVEPEIDFPRAPKLEKVGA
jgi:uncharacterized peroxidase-related enzyme